MPPEMEQLITVVLPMLQAMIASLPALDPALPSLKLAQTHLLNTVLTRVADFTANIIRNISPTDAAVTPLNACAAAIQAAVTASPGLVK